MALSPPRRLTEADCARPSRHSVRSALERHAPAGASELTSQLATWVMSASSGWTTSARASRRRAARIRRLPRVARASFSYTPSRLTNMWRIRVERFFSCVFPTCFGSSVQSAPCLWHVVRRSWIPRKGRPRLLSPSRGTALELYGRWGEPDLRLAVAYRNPVRRSTGGSFPSPAFEKLVRHSSGAPATTREDRVRSGDCGRGRCARQEGRFDGRHRLSLLL